MYSFCFEAYPTFLKSTPEKLVFKLDLPSFSFQLDGPPISEMQDAGIKEEDINRVINEANKIVQVQRGKLKFQAGAAWFYLGSVILLSVILMSYSFFLKEPLSLFLLWVYVMYMMWAALLIMAMDFCIFCSTRTSANKLKSFLEHENKKIKDTECLYEPATHRDNPSVFCFILNLPSKENEKDS